MNRERFEKQLAFILEADKASFKRACEASKVGQVLFLV